MKRWMIGMGAGLSLMSLSGCAKIVKTGTEAELTGETSFEESLDVSSFWDSQAVPEIKENAVDLVQFLTESAGKLDSQAEKYGRYTMGNSGDINFAVHGIGTVDNVNTEKKAGYLEITLEDYTGSEKIHIQIGSVVKKTSIRDYLSFLDINDYGDQIEFAQLSKGINNYVLEHVVGAVDLTSLSGKQVEFYGCFTYDKDDELLITPVVLEVK